ncbi:MAG: agmatinase [bacterium]|nr:agmatinase [bacterium]
MKNPLESQAPFLPYRFLALDDERAGWEAARVAILPVPYDATTSYQPGCRFGPRAILDASRYVEEYDEELEVEPCDVGIYTCPEVEPVAGDPKAMLDRVAMLVSSLIEHGKTAVTLGGEHTLTRAAVEAHVAAHGNLTVLQLDAHLDLRDTYHDSAFSHACVMRRVWDVAPVVAVGARSCSSEEHRWLAERGGACFWAREATGDAAWAEAICSSLTERVYVTIDLDVFDPAVMPAVGTPEPGGLDWPTVALLLKTVAARRQVVGFDIMELSPIPGLRAPEVLAAKLLYKMVGYLFFLNRGENPQPRMTV